jgi:CheY-like chemotaxis protein
VPTILVADDNSNIQKMVSLVFEEKGINVVAVGNGEAACRKVPEVNPDIVLADVFMPVRNGYEVCEFVKRDSRFSETPVILLVGAFDPLDEKEAQRVGADGVLKKPFVPPEPLISLVDSFLQKSERAEEKLAEPPVETAPPPVAVVPPLPLPPPPAPRVQEEPEPEPEEFSYGVAGRDSDIAEDLTTTVREPLATPYSSKQKENEEDEDDSSATASDWKRRRESMDYEISTEESANLLENLSGNSPAGDDSEAEAESIGGPSSALSAHPESEEQPSSETSQAPPRVSPSEWMDYMAPAESVPAAAPEAETPAPSFEAVPPELEAAPPQKEQPVPAPSSGSHALAETPGDQPNDSFEPAASPAVISFRAHAEPQPIPELELAASQPEPEPVHTAPEPFASEPVAATEPQPHEQIAVERAVHEAIAQPESAKQAPLDQAALDAIVAGVVAKLEPQLHQALSQGVLKPLIQELLKGELKSYK